MTSPSRRPPRSARGRRPRICLLLAAGIVTWTAAAEGQEFSYAGTLQYSTGSYVFSERTHSLYLHSSLGMRRGAVYAGISLPLVLQNSGVVTYSGGNLLPTGGPDHEAVRRREPGAVIPGRGRGSGGGGQPDPQTVTFTNDYSLHVADPTISGSLEIYSGFGVLRSIRATAGLKAPVNGLDSGVGTGEWDYSAGGSLAFGTGRFHAFADASYWWLGDLPDLELVDGLSYGVGAGSSLFDGRGSILASVFGGHASIATVDAPLTVALSLGRSLAERRYLSAGASVGLSESSPDFGLFVGWTLGL